MSILPPRFQYAGLMHHSSTTVVALMATLLCACGSGKSLTDYHPEDTFNGSGNDDDDDSSSADGQGRLEDDGTVVTSLLHWQWPCIMPEDTAVVNEQGEVEVAGPGPHSLQIAGDKLDVSVNVNICSAPQLLRDIMFVVDISKTADSADPTNNGDCGRSNAIANVLAGTDNPDLVRVGLVAFDSKAVTTTSLMSVDAFKKDYLNADELCDARLLGPNDPTFAEGLKPVKRRLLEEGREHAIKDVYMITAGDPQSSNDGGTLAANLRAAGVTIMTYQIDNTNNALAEQIASVGLDGALLHRDVSSGSALAAALLEDDRSEPSGGEISYKPVLRDNWRGHTDMFGDGPIDSFQFSIKDLDKINSPQGLDVRIRYWDNRGREYVHEGRLTWE